jgi:hypothetical protein
MTRLDSWKRFSAVFLYRREWSFTRPRVKLLGNYFIVSLSDQIGRAGSNFYTPKTAVGGQHNDNKM